MEAVRIDYQTIEADFDLLFTDTDENANDLVTITAKWSLTNQPGPEDGAESSDISIYDIRVDVAGDWSAFVGYYRRHIEWWFKNAVADWLNSSDRLLDLEQSLQEEADLARVAIYSEN